MTENVVPAVSPYLSVSDSALDNLENCTDDQAPPERTHREIEQRQTEQRREGKGSRRGGLRIFNEHRQYQSVQLGHWYVSQ
jgi:hypothetical protein